MISKSVLAKSVTNRPFLSETVNSILTRFTSRVMRPGSSDGFCGSAEDAIRQKSSAVQNSFFIEGFLKFNYSPASQVVSSGASGASTVIGAPVEGLVKRIR